MAAHQQDTTAGIIGSRAVKAHAAAHLIVADKEAIAGQGIEAGGSPLTVAGGMTVMMTILIIVVWPMMIVPDTEEVIHQPAVMNM